MALGKIPFFKKICETYSRSIEVRMTQLNSPIDTKLYDELKLRWNLNESYFDYDVDCTEFLMAIYGDMSDVFDEISKQLEKKPLYSFTSQGLCTAVAKEAQWAC